MNNHLIRLHLNGDSGFFQILAVREWMDVWPLSQLSRLTSWASTGHDGVRWLGRCDCDTALDFWVLLVADG